MSNMSYTSLQIAMDELCRLQGMIKVKLSERVELSGQIRDLECRRGKLDDGVEMCKERIEMLRGELLLRNGDFRGVKDMMGGSGWES